MKASSLGFTPGFITPDPAPAWLRQGGSSCSRRRARLEDVVMMAQPERHVDRRSLVQSAFVLAGLMASAPIVKPQPASAWCGRMFPSWAYSLSFNEGTLPFAYQPSPDGEPWSGELFLRVLGDDKKEKKSKLSPLIIIPSGPGLPHDVMETLEAAAFSDRRIILFDPIGTGESSPALPPTVSSTEDLRPLSSFIAAQVKAIADFLDLPDHHVLGHGFGAVSALEYAANAIAAHSVNASNPNIRSLTLASPFVVLGPQALQTAYKEAGETVPVCLDTAVRAADFGDIKAVSALEAGSRVEAGLASSAWEEVAGSVPTFVTYGSRDLVGKDVVEKLVRGLEQGRGPPPVVKEFLRSGHLAHVDEREEYVEWLMEQLDATDARAKPKSKKKFAV